MNAQRRQILNKRAHALARELDMDHETLSDFTCVVFGINSMSELTIPELQELVKRLAQEVIIHYRITDSQKHRIYGLGYKDLGWNSARIRKFIHRQTGRWCSVQSLTSKEASKVIAGMEVIAAQEPAAR